MKKKQIEEPDFIGGLGPMTQEEEAALSAYLAQKKATLKTRGQRRPLPKKSQKTTA